MALQRDKILKEGTIRYRQSTISLQKWRPRHLVFKVTHAGRLQLIVYKDYPPTAANEIKEISIDEFGGLEQNLKLDSEKYVFAIITTHITECFSTETPRELTEWRQLLQEYLGKELVVNINVPVKQHLLKAGRGVLRIRNTGFTITTCDNPPRCQGTWHIIHIRKYGGTDLFRFQTGSKCPIGEYLYSIETSDNAGIKKLFNDLSNHRPIFADDRLGRRMTLERSFNRHTPNVLHSPSRADKNRLSLQVANQNSDKHLYENREQVQMTHGKQDSSDLTTPYDNSRRASFDDVAARMESSDLKHTTPVHRVSNSDDKLYQNVSPGKGTNQNGGSPTKRNHHPSLNLPLGYYNLTPPSLVRKNHSNHGSPSSSPEETNLPEQMLSSQSTPLWEAEQPDLSMTVVGDTVIVNKLTNVARQRPRVLSPSSEAADSGGVYQNLEFMRGPVGDPKRVTSEVPFNDEVAPIIPVTIAEEPWSPRNYTNVAFAQEIAQGQASSRSNKSRKSKTHSSVHTTTVPSNQLARKISMPVRSNYRDSSVPFQTSSSSNSRNSSSSDELSKYKSLDYYNFCAPKLPAHSTNHRKSLRDKLTLSSGHKRLDSEKTYSQDTDSEVLSPVSSDAGVKLRDQLASLSDSDILAPTYESIEDFHRVSSEGKLQRRSSSCDCLDIHDSTAKQFASLEDSRPESQNALYDKLVPQRRDGSNAIGIYDSLGPSREDLQSGLSSPDPAESFPSGSDQRLTYYKMTHNYEDVELDHQHSESTSPVGMEHPSDWTKPLDTANLEDSNPLRKSVNLSISKETNTLSRKKQLPMQDEWYPEYSRISKVRPPRLSRESSADVLDGQGKHGTPSNLKSRPRSSLDSMELLSSTDSASETRRESVFSNGSVSSAELEQKTILDHMKQEHSIHRVTHEEVEIKMKHMHTELEKEPAADTQEPPEIPKRGLSEGSLMSVTKRNKGIEETRDISPPIPPKPKEPRFTVSLPQTQIEFVRPPPPPRPRVLCPTELSYASVTFANGGTSVHVEPLIHSQRPSVTISHSAGDVSYVAVHHIMTEGLRATSEQVADHQREFFETKQQS